MRIRRILIDRAETCGGLLDGVDAVLRGSTSPEAGFNPLCLVGPNGAGKSQFLQILAEVFQAAFHACRPEQERGESNPELLFEVDYEVHVEPGQPPTLVRISRRLQDGKKRASVSIERRNGSNWEDCPLDEAATHRLLPSRVIGYTSGENETLSLPFLISRQGYAGEVALEAFERSKRPERSVPDTRLLLIDYQTHLEVLVSNLLLGPPDQRRALLTEARLKDVHSFRCIIQLRHSAVTKGNREGVQLTTELENYIEQLRRCSTCHDFDPDERVYVFDYLVDDETRSGFRHFWKKSVQLYDALHKIAMLNDLAIPRPARRRLSKEIKERRFASRLPEPQDEDRVFRFEEVRFNSIAQGRVVDYVSLSDGEHQLVQILGVFCMVATPNVLFLLDEPESHFNPQWRVRFISHLLDLPTAGGTRRDPKSEAAQQDCLLTTHAPFVPCDIPKESVLIFRRNESGGGIQIDNPGIETFGATFDSILAQCFGVRPPISGVSRKEIAELMKSSDVEEVQRGLERLGDSVQRAFLADHLMELIDKQQD